MHIEELIGALRELGHEVIVSAPSVAAQQDFGASNRWVDRIRSHLPRAFYEVLELAYSIAAYRRLTKLVRQHKPDVIYERYNLYLVAGVWLRRRFGLPLLLEVNSPLAEERSKYSGLAFPEFAKLVESWTWRNADRVLPVTSVLASYIRAAGVADDHIQVVPNGINLAHFEAAPDIDAAKRALGLEGRIILGFTGFVRDWHGIDRVIDWMAARRSDVPVHLLIVGDGPVRGDLEGQARRLGLAGQVTFSGLIPRERVPAMVAAFDVALQPAVTHYASPLKLFEYLVLGKAVIAPREPNLMEVLSDGKNARLFDARVPGAFEAALEELLVDDSLRGRLGQGARHTIDERRLTWIENARRVTGMAEALVRADGIA